MMIEIREEKINKIKAWPQKKNRIIGKIYAILFRNHHEINKISKDLCFFSYLYTIDK